MTKKLILSLLVIFTVFCGRVYAWQIDKFDVDIQLNKDSSIIVTEKILANFTGESKHGIIRKIPVTYHDEKGNSIDVRFRVLGIRDESDNPWQYSEYQSGPYKELKIGSADRTYSIPKTIIIKYEVKGAILFLENHDELYWNAVGTEWDAPINNVSINVHLPEPVAKDMLMTTSYSGKYGLRASDVKTQVLDEQNIVFKGGRYLPYEGLTVVVGWPKGIVEKPPVAPGEGKKSLLWIILPLLFLFGPFLIPIIVFLIMFNLWRKYGKDPKLNKSVVVEYASPEGLTPAEVGTLVDDRIDMRDISATIIDLAVRGYLKIIKAEGTLSREKYAFMKLKDFSNDSSLRAFEKTILLGIFGDAKIGDSVALSSLENNFYKNLESIKGNIFSSLIEKKFYNNNPEDIVKRYRTAGFVVLFIAFFSFPLFLLSVPLGISAVIILAFAKYMPAKTQRGMDTFGKILGFEEFLSRTEKDKIKFEERQNIFEKMLPFAVCLGIANQWANTFVDIYQSPPDWFSADYKGRFSTDHLVYDLSRSVMYMNTAFASMPRTSSSGGGFTVSSGGGFGGGGSSGGGFGGGGGSSW